MDRKNFGYSLKNIPIPSNQGYLKCLIGKVENFIRRIRWKAYFFEKQTVNNDEEKKENFGFKSNAAPPPNDALAAFENDLYEMVRSIEFKSSTSKNGFQRQLDKDAKDIASSPDVLVFADKTTNLYSVKPETYKKLLKENITTTYKKTTASTRLEINKEAKRIAQQLKLEDKMELYADRKAFITLKDHKENFANSPKCRLINPAKGEIGLISKKILEEINSKVRSATVLNQWRNTSDVLTWFTNIPNKKKSKFIKFDIVEFYPSISETLLSDALTFAQTITDIEIAQIEIIKHSRKSLLFDEDNIWVKKGDVMFDVTMGSYDGAEVCELVGLYLLNVLGEKFGKENIGLYRDDGLAAFQNISGPEADRRRKQIIKLFQENGLKITIDTNLQCTDFLDVTLDLRTGIYSPYRKPNDVPLYINVKSNHPPSITKQLPMMISRRISELSINAEEFEKAKPAYEEALKKSGYQTNDLVYQQTKGKRKNRKRNIIWFNPPFSANVKTNIGKIFVRLVKKHFPAHHKFRKIFNKNNIKISYSCMPNMASVINRHNGKILRSKEEDNERHCNCINKHDCPLDGKCLKSCIVYKAAVTVDDDTKYYYGLTEPQFKTRYSNHRKSFRLEDYRKETELSKYVWELHDRGRPYDIRWSIAAQSVPYRCGTRKCDLCVTEKLKIIQADPGTLINRRSEIISKCRHRNKFYLKNVKT